MSFSASNGVTLSRRICKTCNEDKSLEGEYYKHAPSKGGYMTSCKVCMGKKQAIREKGYRNLAIAARKELSDAEYLKNLKMYGGREVVGMVPDALNALKKSLKDKGDTRLKAAVKILENADILGPTKIDLLVNDLRSKTESELQAILAQAKTVPAQTVTND